ncbi:MAG TPA: hypothetical protein PLU30_18140 [Verrucomicrobiae bacterium]|nr:hypothetical protein [Verrucomicrobiae bacterium]
MSAALIAVTGVDDVQIAIEPEVREQSHALLVEAGEILAVANNFDQEAAAEVLARLQEMARGVERARKAVKDPVLEVGRRIDAIASEFSGPLEAEADRIGRLIGAYRTSLQAEIAKREREEREKRQQLIEDANRERARLEAEAAAAKTEAERKAAEEKAGELVRQTNAALVESKQAEVNARMRPAGIVERGSWKYEVEDVNKLFESRPDLCLIEPNGAAIRGAIKGGLRQCPGLRIFKDSKVTTRRAA